MELIVSQRIFGTPTAYNQHLTTQHGLALQPTTGKNTRRAGKPSIPVQIRALAFYREWQANATRIAPQMTASEFILPFPFGINSELLLYSQPRHCSADSRDSEPGRHCECETPEDRLREDCQGAFPAGGIW